MASVRKAASNLAPVGGRPVPFTAVPGLSRKLDVEPDRLLRIVGLPKRTASRRRTQGFLAAEEADRLLRVARIVGQAERVFGSERKASRWLTTVQPMLGDVAPLDLLGSDAGAHLVGEELVRIDYGDFA